MTFYNWTPKLFYKILSINKALEFNLYISNLALPIKFRLLGQLYKNITNFQAKN